MSAFRKVVVSGLLLVLLSTCLVDRAHAIPAFARKYGLRCSACHEAWPMLNYFGQKFKDNGYQLMNDRDSPIWQNNGYWPVTMRITPSWHRESTNKVAIDTATGPLTGQQQITAHGFDVGGLDMLSAGTLDKNISFLFVLSSDENASFHFESVNARLDNLFGSPWLNVKMGKFELDNIVSEKRGLTLTASGGGFQLYHFIPVGDSNFVGQIGDNQFGLEWMGHSANDRTRISAALLSSTDGNVDLPGSNSYTGFFAGSQAFDVGKLGTQRVGFYAMVGQAATNSLTADGLPIAGGGFGNKGFSRVGFNGIFYLGKLDFQVVTQHGSDSAFFGTATQVGGPTPLPTGARSAVWNGAFVETHYVYNPQLIFIQRSEWVRMSQQSIPGTPSNLGNLDNYVVGYRYMPFMNSRAGFAFHNEYSWIRQRGGAPDGTDLTSNSLMLGFDFDF
jgi:hypothetical protein